jgi:hypothetical protein
MPYFERMARLKNTLKSFKTDGYFESDYPYKVQVSVCDDGSMEERVRHERFDGIPLILTELPLKTGWLNPCVPINRAVRATDSPLILLQSPETYHPMPVLEKMASLLDAYNKVVLCPTKVDGQKGWRWYAHPVHRPVKYWFCQLMSRDFFEEIGGFDELYRWGQGFDDDAFADSIEKHGGTFIWADECHVVHVKVPRNYTLPPIKGNRKRFKNV